MRKHDPSRRRESVGAVFDVLVIGGIRSDPLRCLVALGALAFAAALFVATHLTGLAATSGLTASGDDLDQHVDLVVTGSGRGVDENLFRKSATFRALLKHTRSLSEMP